MLARLAKLPAPLIYAASVALERSFSLITIPLMAAYLSPGAYGNFDVAVACSELAIMIVGLGMIEQLIRFASTANSADEEARCAGEVMGCAMLTATCGALAALFIAPHLQAALSLEIGLPALQFMLVAACLNNLMALPTAWLRLTDDATGYLQVVASRTLCQVGGIALALTQGYGADGVLISNALVLIAFSIWLGYRQSLSTPFRLSTRRFAQVGNYGAPIVGAMIAMFMLGSANRLFLSQWVNADVLGQFGLAARLSLATILLLYPLELWWLPKRIAALKEPGGLERSAEVWGMGFGILVLSAMGVSLLGPIFIHAFLPTTYLGAIALLPLLVITQVLHAVSGITEVGSYARETGYRVLAIDVLGAAAAIIGFALLIPSYGAYGAIAAVIVAQALRISAYVIDGKTLAPIRYRWPQGTLVAIAASCFVIFAPDASDYADRLLWTVFASAALLVVIPLTGLVSITTLPEMRARFS